MKDPVRVLRRIDAPHVFYGWTKQLARRKDVLEEAWLDPMTKKTSLLKPGAPRDEFKPLPKATKPTKPRNPRKPRKSKRPTPVTPPMPPMPEPDPESTGDEELDALFKGLQ